MKFWINLIISTMFVLSLYVKLIAVERVPGESIVWLENNIRDNKIDEFEQRFSNIQLKRQRELSPRFNIWLFEFDEVYTDEDSIIEMLKNDKSVKLVQFNHRVEKRETTPNDPRFNEQWALKNTGQGSGTPGADISATHAWDLSTGGLTQNGKEIVIAVIDDGFALNHPDINWWKNENEIPGNGQDNDGNGYIDDYDGWNAYNNSPNLPVNNHGTHVSGIIGAIGDNNIGVTGVGWDLKVMPIAGSSSSEAIVVAAYNYALENRILYNETNGDIGAYVVATNSSFGINFGNPENYPIWGEMYNLMGQAGILSTAATMNINANVDIVGDIPTSFPSPYLISVTNTTNTDNKNSSAAYGATTIDLGAPGTSILSTTSNLNYGNLTGTSMAAPHVAGVIGLMYSVADIALLQLYEESPGELALLFRELLLEGVDVIPSLENITVTGGRLNAYQALVNVIEQTPGYPPPVNLHVQLVNDVIILTWLPPLDPEPAFYQIFRNGEFLSNVETLFFYDYQFEWGYDYEYFVVAYFSPDEFSPESESVYISTPPDFPVLIKPYNGQEEIKPPIEFVWSESYGTEYWTFVLSYDKNFDPPLITKDMDINFFEYSLLEDNKICYWKVKSHNESGTRGWSEVFTFKVYDSSNTSSEVIVNKTRLEKNIPNPFNPITKIKYTIGKETFVSLSIFNIIGQEIKVLTKAFHEPGKYSVLWDGKNEEKIKQPSGIYFYMIETEDYRDVKKMLLLK